jgi:hypothetical protein
VARTALSQTTFLVALLTPIGTALGELTGVAGVVNGDLGAGDAALTGEVMFMTGEAARTGEPGMGRTGDAACTGDVALAGD